MTRLRPEWHFTPVEGWMNDPHGIFFDGDLYHLFFQYVEDSLKWEPTIAWGHATSPDLLNWKQTTNAITPLEHEAGCWSGCVAFKDGVPYMFYTSPAIEEWNNGSVVVTAPNKDLSRWNRLDQNPIITIPRELDVKDFRDPQIRKHGDKWRMLMAAGLNSGHGAIVEYESSDLLTWDLRGILANSETEVKEPTPSSTVWECPQLFQIDGQWVLLISAMDANGHIGVRYALGNYEEDRFIPTFWGDFSKSDLLYATSIFYDASNQLTAISWFKEIDDVAPAGSTWTSAQSLPAHLCIRDNKLMVTPIAAVQFQKLDRPTEVEVATAWAVELESKSWTLHINAEQSWSISLTSGVLKIQTEGLREFQVEESSNFKIVVDADLLEIYTNRSDGLIATRVPANEHARIQFSSNET
jgi:beta-fructofuranosidase